MNLPERHFILTRKIGHEFEMPGSQEWVVHRDSCQSCYICDRKLYTVFFWSPEIGSIEADQVGLTPELKYRILQVIFKDRDRNEMLRRLSTTLDPRLTQELKKEAWNEKIHTFEVVEESLKVPK